MSVAAATAATVTTATVPLTLFPPSPPSVWVPAHIILSSNNSSMSAPPVPPRPPTTQPGTPGPGRRPPLPPPPPLPTGFRPDVDPYQESPPRFGDPMLAPRPQKLLSSVPADMARTLEAQYAAPPAPTPIPQPYMQQPPPPQIPQVPSFNFQSPQGGPGGFRPPTAFAPPPQPMPARYPTPAPPPGFAGGFFSPPQQSQQPQHPYSSSPLQPFPAPSPPRTPQPPLPSFTPVQPNWVGGATPPPIPASQRHSIYDLGFNDAPARSSSVRPISPPKNNTNALIAPLPTPQTLQQAWQTLQSVPDPARRITWSKDVFALLDRTLASAGQAPEGPLNLSDAALQRLADLAVDVVRNMTANASPASPGQPLPSHIAEALYLRGSLEASGMFPAVFPASPRDAFRDFEAAARAGHGPAWFKLGRDYESVGDAARARDCFERGVRNGVGSCFYRIGMAYLQGQLGIAPPNPQTAMGLLQRAAVLANVEVPQPAFVYALLLLGEFPAATVPAPILAQFIPAGSSAILESRKYLERAAYLNFAPAQSKLGHAYEYATPPFGFDPLMSVQYYSLASQAGEVEADMALSKWFLCGAPGEGGFDKDEALAVVFAEKAARRGLASAEFAMGYYAEVGVGGLGPDLAGARKWYQKAARGGNEDAQARLRELEGGGGKMIDRKEHEGVMEDKLVRTRTQARERAQASGAGVGGAGGSKYAPVVSAPAPRVQTPGQPQGSGSGSSLAPPQPHLQPQPQQPLPQQPQPQLQPQPQPQPQPQSTLAPAPMRPTQADAMGLARAASKSQNTGGYRLRKDRAGKDRPGTGGGTGTPGASPKPAGNALLPNAANANANTVVYPVQPSKGPATFQEMGYHSQKLDQKECIIM